MAWSDALGRLNASVNRVFGQAATYTPPGAGSPVAVTVVLDQATEYVALPGEVDAAGPAWVATVRMSDFTDRDPAIKGRLALADGRTFEVARTPGQDADGVLWRLDLRQVFPNG